MWEEGGKEALASSGCHDKLPQTVQLTQQTCIALSSGGWKPKIKVLAILVPGGGPSSWLADSCLLMSSIVFVLLRWHEGEREGEGRQWQVEIWVPPHSWAQGSQDSYRKAPYVPALHYQPGSGPRADSSLCLGVRCLSVLWFPLP